MLSGRIESARLDTGPTTGITLSLPPRSPCVGPDSLRGRGAMRTDTPASSPGARAPVGDAAITSGGTPSTTGRRTCITIAINAAAVARHDQATRPPIAPGRGARRTHDLDDRRPRRRIGRDRLRGVDLLGRGHRDRRRVERGIVGEARLVAKQLEVLAALRAALEMVAHRGALETTQLPRRPRPDREHRGGNVLPRIRGVGHAERVGERAAALAAVDVRGHPGGVVVAEQPRSPGGQPVERPGMGDVIVHRCVLIRPSTNPRADPDRRGLPIATSRDSVTTACAPPRGSVRAPARPRSSLARRRTPSPAHGSATRATRRTRAR